MTMRKFWKRQIEVMGGDAKMLKSRAQIAREVIAAMIEAHGTGISVKNVGLVIGRTAWKITKPCLEMWDGIKEGFSGGQ